MQVQAPRNRLRTALVAVSAVGVPLLAGSPAGPPGLLVGGAAGTGLLVLAWARADRHALRATRAYPVGETEQPALYRVVRDLCTAARQPVPRIWVSPTLAPNAFATGRSPRRAALCCTAGLLELLDERELRAVLAHELAHVRRRDTMAAGVAAALAGSLLACAGLAVLLSGDDDEGPGPLGAVLMLVLAPATALLLRLGAGRGREYAADAEAARVTGDPLALAAALGAIDRRLRDLPLPAEGALVAAGHLMTTDPFTSGGLARLLSTHPPVRERVARLEALAGYPR